MGMPYIKAEDQSARIIVSNPLPQPRTEMVEVEASSLPVAPFVIRDSRGSELPWQLTHDGKVIFPATVGPSGEASYTVAPGKPAPVDERVYAAFIRSGSTIWRGKMIMRPTGHTAPLSGPRAGRPTATMCLRNRPRARWCRSAISRNSCKRFRITPTMAMAWMCMT